MAAARFVDRHLAPVAHKIRPTQLDRLVEEAVARHMPEEPKSAAARLGPDATSPSTTTPPASPAPPPSPARSTSPTPSTSTDAVRAEAQRIGDLGNTKTLDQRRATAIGNIARRDLTLDYPTNQSRPTSRPNEPTDEPTDEPTGERARKAARRPVVLHLHLSQAAIHGPTSIRAVAVRRVGSGRGARGVKIGLGRGGRRRWAQRLPATMRPTGAAPATGSSTGEPGPGRSRPKPRAAASPGAPAPLGSSDATNTPATTTTPSPTTRADPPAPASIAPLCRRHHRLKTHGGWRYHALERGTYVWTSPHALPVPPRPHRHPRRLPRPTPLTNHPLPTPHPPARPDHPAPQPAVPTPAGAGGMSVRRNPDTAVHRVRNRARSCR